MGLNDAGATAKYLVQDRDSRYAATFDAVFEGEGIAIVKTGIRVERPRRPPTRSTRRHPPRGPTCHLSCTDEAFGTYRRSRPLL
jgi:hypothetical protein